MVSGFPEQTVARQGSWFFCVCKSSAGSREHELARTVGEKRRLYQLCWWRGRRKPQKYEPLERMNVFAGNARHRHIFQLKIQAQYIWLYVFFNDIFNMIYGIKRYTDFTGTFPLSYLYNAPKVRAS
jgi:hypothetical protein